MRNYHHGLGPNGEHKTGQRVPSTGAWQDQFGVITHHDAGATFPPCIDRKGTCAYRVQVNQARTRSA